MQDKEMTYRSQEPVDIGWQRMAALLDEEMPVQGQRRRRRLIAGWYWRGAVAAAVVAAGLFALLRLGMVSPTEAVVAHNTEALHTAPNYAGLPVFPEEPCPETPVASAAQEASVFVESKVASAPLLRHHDWSPAMLTTHQSAPLLDEIAANMPAVHEALPAAAPEAEVVGTASLMAEALPGHFRPVIPVPTVLVNTPTSTAMPALHLSPPPATTPKASRWRLGVEAAAGVHGASGALVYGAGPVMEYSIASTVALRGGVQVASAQYQLSAKNANRRENDNDPTITGGGQSGYNLMRVVAESVQQGYSWSFSTFSVQLPMTISYALHPRLMAEAGLSPALISTISRLDGVVSADALANYAVPTNVDSYRSAVDNSTERIELLLSAGVRYRLTPHWSVGLQYQLGMNDLQPLSTIQARQQNIRLSGVYYF